MASGKVKWFNAQKGYGFIANETGQDVFVHQTAIIGKGYRQLVEGEEVLFDVVTSDKGLKACNVQRVNPPPTPPPQHAKPTDQPPPQARL